MTAEVSYSLSFYLGEISKSNSHDRPKLMCTNQYILQLYSIIMRRGNC